MFALPSDVVLILFHIYMIVYLFNVNSVASDSQILLWVRRICKNTLIYTSGRTEEQGRTSAVATAAAGSLPPKYVLSCIFSRCLRIADSSSFGRVGFMIMVKAKVQRIHHDLQTLGRKRPLMQLNERQSCVLSLSLSLQEMRLRQSHVLFVRKL